MKNTHFQKLLLAIIFAATNMAYAGSFQVLELGASVMGSANSGTSVSDDPSVQYFNPAAMQNVETDKISVNGAFIQPVMNFNPTYMTRGGDDTELSRSPGDIKDLNIEVPALYYIKVLNRDWRAGFGVTVPYGLKTDYDKNSAAKYFATYSSMETVNFNPSFSYRISDTLSVGAGVNVQRLSADLNTMFAAGAEGDINIQNNGTGWGHGWNAGIHYRPLEPLRLGLSYRSKVSHNLSGKTKILGPQAAKDVLEALGIEEGNAHVNTTMPEFAIFSAQYDINPKWSVMGDFQYTRWSRIKDITLIFGAQNKVKSITTKYYNTRRVAFGTKYRYTPKLTLRVGYALDQSPVSARYRTARIPDNDRVWCSTGASYQFNKHWEGHIAYTHVSFRDSTINEYEALVDHRLIANYSGHANLLALQGTYSFS